MPERTGWFFDSVTLSNFALVGGLELLSSRYRTRWQVTTQVVDELTQGVNSGYSPLADCLDLVGQGVLRVASLDRIERTMFRQLTAHLGEGEAGTIAAAHHHKGVVVTDDLAARRTCSDLALPLTGTIGILRAAVRDQDLTLAAANALLLKMIAAGFHSPVSRLQDC